MRRGVTLVVGGAICLLAIYFLLGVVPALGPVSQPALLYSVARNLGVSDIGSKAACHPISRGVRRCYVDYSGDSNGATYRVVMRGYHCWKAERIDRRSNWSPAVSGCAHVADQLRFWAR